MPTFDLNRLFIPTKLKNSDLNGDVNANFKTHDRVYLEEGFAERRDPTWPTNYADAYGASEDEIRYWCRTACKNISERIYTKNSTGRLDSAHPTDASVSVCPAMRIDVNAFIEFRDFLAKLCGKNDDTIINILRNDDGEHHIRFGLRFPSSKAYHATKLEDLLQQGKLSPTGATYTGLMDQKKFVQNLEYPEWDEHFIRAEYTDGKYNWFRNEPIWFNIRNWNDLPRSINPRGKDKADYMEVVALKGLFTMPFYILGQGDHGDETDALWQNSAIRAYLNGYDLHKEIDRGNGKRGYKSTTNFDFSGRGFLYEASQYLRARYKEITIGNEATARAVSLKDKQPTAQPNPYGFTYDELSNDDLLKLYIQSKTPVFLHGPSGVGKSSRVKQIDPNPTHITLRPQMNPEEVDGTLDRETGKYIPPLWYTQLCEKCEKDPAHIHTLFIDELTNVKPTVQSLVYSIILDRAGKDGLWPLPENSVVVAAGNENADNLAAYPLTNALFRRFSHIYYKIDKEAWLDWAMGVNKLSRLMPVAPDKEKRARIHPMIVAFVMAQRKNILHQDLDEENPKIVTDPRKWEIASNVLYATKNPHALQPAVGNKITANFVDFVQSIRLTVADVIKGNYQQQSLAKLELAQTYATIAGLCTATEKDLPAVREFINRDLGKEFRPFFDSLWIRNDPERAAVIGELDASTTLNTMTTANATERQI